MQMYKDVAVGEGDDQVWEKLLSNLGEHIRKGE